MFKENCEAICVSPFLFSDSGPNQALPSHSNDEHDTQAFMWSLECTPPLLLYASYHQELVSFLGQAHLQTIPSQNQDTTYAALGRQVKEARIAYLIFSSFDVGCCRYVVVRCHQQRSETRYGPTRALRNYSHDSYEVKINS